GVPSALLAAGAGVTALKSHPAVAAGLALLSALLTALLTFLQPEKAGAAHHEAGIRYSHLRGKLRRLRLIDVLDTADPAAQKQRLEGYAAEKTEIMKISPHIGGLAYRLGKASILRREHRHKVDREAEDARRLAADR